MECAERTPCSHLRHLSSPAGSGLFSTISHSKGCGGLHHYTETPWIRWNRRINVMRETLELPRFSLKERDRRWAEIRREMKQNSLDCLLICGAPMKFDFTVANARYITHVGGNSTFSFVVFPLEGEPTCFLESS